MSQMIDQLVQKMGLIDEPKIIEKTTELLRLLDLRSTNISATINEYAKIILCIDLAAAFLGIPIDQENALKLSGLRKTPYANNKRMFEKLLDLNKQIGINEICTKLGINELAKKATELLEMYKQIVENEANDIDITHPQYPSMAVYQAGKLNQKRISKSKIMAISHLRPSQWTQLEQRWDKIVATHYTATKDKKIKSPPADGDKEADTQKSTLEIKRPKVAEVEDYEIWKRRMLSMAHLELAHTKHKSSGDKENLVDLTE
ncbi:origin recognition complex subunit 6 [Episyrphus balteatus]|uniref:origin recognition complex subunit 6 n=1 Tax=Episyrphus balteatus TaxID=286459 RepID=UPI002485A4B7|nr:origin recognition complex subunit 6 [Episyrphus balteatus]